MSTLEQANQELYNVLRSSPATRTPASEITADKIVDKSNSAAVRRKSRHLITIAMQDADRWVLKFEYTDKKGVRTIRYVSPIRFESGERFLGLCLCREEPRRFEIDRCDNLVVLPAAEILMPMQLAVVA